MPQTRITWLTTDIEADFTESGDSVFSATVTEHELRLDGVLRESHAHASIITDRAIDEGMPLVFSKRVQPDRITLEGVVTDAPIGDVPPSGFGRDGIQGEIRALDLTGGARANVLQFSQPITRVRDVHETVSRLAKEAIEVTVTTGSRTYVGVQVESVEVSRGSGEGGSANVEISLRSVRIGTTQSTDPQPREPRRQAPRDRGHQETETPPEASDLQRVVDSIRQGTFVQDFQNIINGGPAS
jgi:hypothetical protein